MQRASARGIHLVTGAVTIVADAFRDAYIATGMNLVQSIVLCTLGLARSVIGFTVQPFSALVRVRPEPKREREQNGEP